MRKELSFEQGVQLLKQGKVLECQLSSRVDNTEIVKKEERLKYLYDLSLSKTQWCKIFEKKEPKIKIPEDSIVMSFDEAYEMVHSGQVVFYQNDGEEEKILTISQLMNVRREFDVQGRKLLLYWYE